MTSKDVAERLDRIEALVQKLYDSLILEKQTQAEEIDKYIQRWEAGQFEAQHAEAAD